MKKSIKEAVNFQIILIAGFIISVGCITIGSSIVGSPTIDVSTNWGRSLPGMLLIFGGVMGIIALIIGLIILPLMAVMNIRKGEKLKYPFSIRILR